MAEKVVLSWSGGKDSARALYEMRRSQEYEVVALLTSFNGEYDRVTMHGVRRLLVEQQAEALSLPMESVVLPRVASNEEYESRTQAALARLQEVGVSAVAFGDIFLEDLRKYREDNLARIGMKAVFPIWGRDTRELTSSFVSLGFQSIVTCVDSRVLSKTFAGRVIDTSFLAELPPGVDPCGENGEYHSFVFAGPIFKQRIPVIVGEVVCRDSFYFCDLLPENSTEGK
ncbi:MAG: ATP-binding protein [Dehalococcoidales bacterium]|nr:ATP-binding protein [Dehalococcoidales bacterium]